MSAHRYDDGWLRSLNMGVPRANSFNDTLCEPLTMGSPSSPIRGPERGRPPPSGLDRTSFDSTFSELFAPQHEFYIRKGRKMAPIGAGRQQTM